MAIARRTWRLRGDSDYQPQEEGQAHPEPDRGDDTLDHPFRQRSRDVSAEIAAHRRGDHHDDRLRPRDDPGQGKGPDGNC